MTYTINKTVVEEATDKSYQLVQQVQLDRIHVAVDYEKRDYVEVDKFIFQTGFVQLDSGTKVEMTRILMSCGEGHEHGVYYQAPRQMELWEAMFAIGETSAEPIVFPEDDKEGK